MRLDFTYVNNSIILEVKQMVEKIGRWLEALGGDPGPSVIRTIRFIIGARLVAWGINILPLSSYRVAILRVGLYRAENENLYRDKWLKELNKRENEQER